MARKFLFLSLVLALFSSQAAAQQTWYPFVMQLPAGALAADAASIAAAKSGFVADSIPGSGKFLVYLPTVPARLWNTEQRWLAPVEAVTLQSIPHSLYLHMN